MIVCSVSRPIKIEGKHYFLNELQLKLKKLQLPVKYSMLRRATRLVGILLNEFLLLGSHLFFKLRLFFDVALVVLSLAGSSYTVLILKKFNLKSLF